MAAPLESWNEYAAALRWADGVDEAGVREQLLCARGIVCRRLDGHLDQAGVWLNPDVLGLGGLTLVRPLFGGPPPAEGGSRQCTSQ
jgi:hypothetical protein